MREKLVKLLIKYGVTWYPDKFADYLLENGVVVKERGKWANAYSSGTHLYRCTECGEYIEAIWTGGYDFKYCQNCGAKMGGDEE